MSNIISNKNLHQFQPSEVCASIRSMKASQLQQLQRKGHEIDVNESMLARL